MPPRTTRPRGLPRTLETFRAALRELYRRAGEPPFREMSKRAHYSASTLCRVLSVPKAPSLGALMGFVIACRGSTEVWGQNYLDLHRALRANEVIESFDIGPVAPPWPSSFIGSEVLALAERHMAVSLGAETLRETLWLVANRPPPSWSDLPIGTRWILLETMRFVERAATPRLFAARMQEARLYSGLKLQEISARTAQQAVQAVTRRERIAVSTLSNLCNPKHGRFPQPDTVRAFLMVLGAPQEVIDVWISMLHIAVSFKSKKDPYRISLTNEWFAVVDRHFSEYNVVNSGEMHAGAIGSGGRAAVSSAGPPSRGTLARSTR